MANENVTLKVGQRWRYGSYCIAEIESFTDYQHVRLRVVQTLRDPYYVVGKILSHTLRDDQYSLLEGQDAP